VVGVLVQDVVLGNAAGGVFGLLGDRVTLDVAGLLVGQASMQRS